MATGAKREAFATAHAAAACLSLAPRASFCKSCITARLQAAAVCPFGHALDARSIIPNLAVQSHLDSLPVRCPQHASLLPGYYWGPCCTWTGTLQDLDRHLGECPRALTACRRPGCGHTAERHEVRYHEQQVCEFRTVACPHVGCKMQKAAGAMHKHTKRCTHAAVACQNACGKLYTRRDMTQHLEECPRQPVPCIIPGCGMQVERGAMHEHLRDEARRHALLQDSQRHASDKRAGDAEKLQQQAEGRAALLAAEVAALKRELAAQKAAQETATYASKRIRETAAAAAASEAARQSAAAAAAAAATPTGRRLRRNAGPAVSASAHGPLNTRCPLSGKAITELKEPVRCARRVTGAFTAAHR